MAISHLVDGVATQSPRLCTAVDLYLLPWLYCTFDCYIISSVYKFPPTTTLSPYLRPPPNHKYLTPVYTRPLIFLSAPLLVWMGRVVRCARYFSAHSDTMVLSISVLLIVIALTVTDFLIGWSVKLIGPSSSSSSPPPRRSMDKPRSAYPQPVQIRNELLFTKWPTRLILLVNFLSVYVVKFLFKDLVNADAMFISKSQVVCSDLGGIHWAWNIFRY